MRRPPLESLNLRRSNTIATIHDHPDQRRALVLELIPSTYEILGSPPTLISCTRDNFEAGFQYSYARLLEILISVASAAAHLHSLGIMHGDLYAHNTLVDGQGHALLGDLGAATRYDRQNPISQPLELLDVRAFGNLIDDLLTHRNPNHGTADKITDLRQLLEDCHVVQVHYRPRFSQICDRLRCMQ